MNPLNHFMERLAPILAGAQQPRADIKTHPAHNEVMARTAQDAADVLLGVAAGFRAMAAQQRALMATGMGPPEWHEKPK